MTYQIEVCIDNLESISHAIAGGATRIELCSALALGGLTPSIGMMAKASKLSNVPVYAMIRPRQGDFIYSQNELELMLEDIDAAANTGLDGVVFGVLNASGTVDINANHLLIERAKFYRLGTTFHRAIDHTRDWPTALKTIGNLGFDRVLTSGQATSAEKGLEIISAMVQSNQVEIMAGAGINSTNVADIIKASGVEQIHLSGKTNRPSKMPLFTHAQMGSAEIDDNKIPITDQDKIADVVNVLMNK
jgi:copper homeostasis protein